VRKHDPTKHYYERSEINVRSHFKGILAFALETKTAPRKLRGKNDHENHSTLNQKRDKPPETRNLSDGCYRLAPRCRPPIRCWASRERDPPPRFWKTFLKNRLKRLRETPPKTNKLDHTGSTPRRKKNNVYTNPLRGRRGAVAQRAGRTAPLHNTDTMPR
jgi:hypothetical protein